MFNDDASVEISVPTSAVTRKPATKRKPASTRVKPKAKPAATKRPARKVRVSKPKSRKAKGKTKGKPGRPPRYHAADHRQMRKLYASGLTLDAVGMKMKCTSQCVRHIFIKHGWKMRHGKAARRGAK